MIIPKIGKNPSKNNIVFPSITLVENNKKDATIKAIRIKEIALTIG